jgi:hypothetical protein
MDQIRFDAANPRREGGRHRHRQPPRPELGDPHLEAAVDPGDSGARPPRAHDHMRDDVRHLPAQGVDLLLDSADDWGVYVLVDVHDSQRLDRT